MTRGVYLAMTGGSVPNVEPACATSRGIFNALSVMILGVIDFPPWSGIIISNLSHPSVSGVVEDLVKIGVVEGKLQDRDCYNNGERGLILDGG